MENQLSIGQKLFDEIYFFPLNVFSKFWSFSSLFSDVTSMNSSRFKYISQFAVCCVSCHVHFWCKKTCSVYKSGWKNLPSLSSEQQRMIRSGSLTAAKKILLDSWGQKHEDVFLICCLFVYFTFWLTLSVESSRAPKQNLPIQLKWVPA